ncbi:UNVERIFIED_CONTAM: hypothetical protein HDU68_011202 [Siphonaria sp. JEL0065]|nr:hypothetical protein HDU68_011202 [Siphonaria sp. JEL0065]
MSPPPTQRKKDLASSFSSDSFFVVGHYSHCSPLQLPKPASQGLLHGHSPLVDIENHPDYLFGQPSLLVLDESQPGQPLQPNHTSNTNTNHLNHTHSHALSRDAFASTRTNSLTTRPRFSSISSTTTTSTSTDSVESDDLTTLTEDWLRRVVDSAGKQLQSQQDVDDNDSHDELRRTPPLLLNAEDLSENNSVNNTEDDDENEIDEDDEVFDADRLLRVGSHASTTSFFDQLPISDRRIWTTHAQRSVGDEDDDGFDDSHLTPPSSTKPVFPPPVISSTAAVPIPSSSLSSSKNSKSSSNTMDNLNNRRTKFLLPPQQRPFTSGSWATEDCFNRPISSSETADAFMIPFPSLSNRQHLRVKRSNLSDAPRHALLKAASLSCSPTRPELWYASYEPKGGGDNGGGPRVIPESFITFSNTYYGSVCNASTIAGTPEDLFLKLEEKELRRIRTFTQQQQRIANLINPQNREYVPGNFAAYKSILEKQKRGESIGCGGRLVGAAGNVATVLSASLRESSKSWTPYSTAAATACTTSTPALPLKFTDSAKDVSALNLNISKQNQQQQDQHQTPTSILSKKPIIVKRMLIMGLDTSEDHVASAVESTISSRPPLPPPNRPASRNSSKRRQRHVQFSNEVQVQFHHHHQNQTTHSTTESDNDEEEGFKISIAPLDGSSDTPKFRDWRRRKRRAERVWKYQEIEAMEESFPHNQPAVDAHPSSVLDHVGRSLLNSSRRERSGRGGREGGAKAEGGYTVASICGWVVGVLFCLGERGRDVDEGDEEEGLVVGVRTPLLGQTPTMTYESVSAASFGGSQVKKGECCFGDMFVDDDVDREVGKKKKLPNALRWSDDESSSDSDDGDF